MGDISRTAPKVLGQLANLLVYVLGRMLITGEGMGIPPVCMYTYQIGD